jgi:putative nucleotidyltransferase with HDIG domain
MATRLAAPPAPPARRRFDGPVTTSTVGLLPVSVLATISLLVLPGATVALATAVTGARLAGPAGWLLTACVSLAYMLGGARLWARHPRSSELSWGELVLWSWARRRRAEGTLERSAGLLEDEVSEYLNPQGRREQVKVLRELNAALEVRDPYTRGHARRVERHAHRIALALRCSDDDIFDVRLAASLHDVGKIKVPDRILRKDGALDESEWAVMKQHSEVGAELLRRLGNQNVVAAVRSHHERWDGRGYPDGISGTDIPLGARIIAVADTFDAITSCRPYRDRSDRAHAVAVLKSEAGKQFDPAVVSAFLSTTPHKAAAFAGVAALVAPAARKLASQWGVVVNKAGAVSLAGTMTASAFTGVAGVERPIAKRLEGRDKPAATVEAPPEEGSATKGTASEGAPSPQGKALGHSKKAHEGGNGKSNAGGKAKSAAEAKDKSESDNAPSPRGKALGHAKKAHEGGNGKAHAGGNGKSNAGGNGKSKAPKKEDTAAAPTETVEDGTTPEAPTQPAPAKPKPSKPEPAPVVEEPADPAPEVEAPVEVPPPGKANGKSKDE